MATEAATGAAEHAEKAGMPQLDFSTWPNQIFWLAVTLVVIYLVLTRIALPRIGGVLAERRGTITNESSKIRSYEVTVEFLRPGTSVRRYIASTSVDDVAPGATAPVIVNEVVSDEELDCNVVSVSGPLPFGQS